MKKISLVILLSVIGYMQATQDKNSNKDLKNQYMKTLLAGNTEEAKALLNTGLTDQEQQLFKAVIDNDLQKTQELLNAGVNSNVTNILNQNPLETAVNSILEDKIQARHNTSFKVPNRLPVIKTCIKAGADVNTITDNQTLLLTACRTEDVNLVKLLLDAGAKPNLGSVLMDSNYTPLMYAAGQFNLKLITLLITHGADINAVDSGGNTPLLYALGSLGISLFGSNNAKPSHTKTVQYLLKQGANINVHDNNGTTPIMMASTYSHDEADSTAMLQLLIKAKANIKEKDNAGKTALMYACQGFGDKKMIEYLIKNGININDTDTQGKTALMYTCTGFPDKERIAYLLSKGANVNATDKDGQTALTLLSIPSYHADIAQLLINAKAKVNISTSDGMTPLLYACQTTQKLGGEPYPRNLNPEFIQVLLDAGADTSVKDKEGKTVFDIVKDNQEVLDMLNKATQTN